MDTLAKKLRHIRKERGLNQETLAQMSGLEQSLISKLERGVIQKTTGLVSLANALRCNPNWLDSGDGPMDATGEASGSPSNQALARIGSADAATNSVATGAEIVEMISDKLGALTDDQRKDMSAKLAALALAPDSPTLKKSISESLGSAPLPGSKRTL